MLRNGINQKFHNLDSSDLTKSASIESAKLDNIEHYGRRQNLEFKGIPQTEGEDTDEIVINLAKMLKVDIKKQRYLNFT